MNEEKLIELMKQNFPAKEEFRSFKQEFGSLKEQVAKSFNDVHTELRGIRSDIKEMSEKIDELSVSSKAFDGILEHYPIERIDRLEQHAGLPTFVPSIDEE